MSGLFRKCGSLDVSQSYGLALSVTGIALHLPVTSLLYFHIVLQTSVNIVDTGLIHCRGSDTHASETGPIYVIKRKGEGEGT
jgi:hypothetical protein